MISRYPFLLYILVWVGFEEKIAFFEKKIILVICKKNQDNIFIKEKFFSRKT